jgi:hypothetical protein
VESLCFDRNSPKKPSIAISRYKTRTLSQEQVSLIRSILSNPNSTKEMKTQIQKILFYRYHKWATHKAYEFIHTNRKYRYINKRELSFFALKGLEYAVINYNPKYGFSKFAEMNIKYSIYLGLIKLKPLNVIPSHLQMSKEWRKKNVDKYRNSLAPEFIGTSYWKMDNINRQIEEEENMSISKIQYIQDYIATLDAFSQRVFKMKYPYFFDDYYHYYYRSQLMERENTVFSKKCCANKRIAAMMCCSEEKIRLNLNSIKKGLIRDFYVQNEI